MVTAPDRVLLTGSRSILPRPGDEKRMPSPSSTGSTTPGSRRRAPAAGTGRPRRRRGSPGSSSSRRFTTVRMGRSRSRINSAVPSRSSQAAPWRDHSSTRTTRRRRARFRRRTRRGSSTRRTSSSGERSRSRQRTRARRADPDSHEPGPESLAPLKNLPVSGDSRPGWFP
jgi:hypothetical protein